MLHNRSQETGSAIFIILIGVALFGALSFVVADMLRQGDPSKVSEQKLALMADEIVEYGRSIRQSVQALRISNNCAEDGISFEDTNLTGYAHAPVAADSCKIFDPAGGGMTYIAPKTEWLDPSNSAEDHYGEYYFSGADKVDKVGNSGTNDLIMFLPWIKEGLCKRINVKLGIITNADTLDNDDWTFDPTNEFVGTYSTTANLIGSDDDTLDGTMAGCGQDDSGDFFFYQVLIPR